MISRPPLILSAVIIAGALSGCGDRTAPTNDLVAEDAPVVAPSDLPDTDIYLGRLTIEDSGVRIDDLRAVVAEPGYANQPMFEPGGASFLFTRQEATGKTDIWRYEIASGAVAPVTDSSDRSEFSPKPAPGGGVSYIQENPAGEMTRVHRDGGAVVELQPLGYYEWLDAGAALGVFYRSEPPQLHIVDVETGENRNVASGIGRALQASPSGEALYFTSTAGGANRLYRVASSEAVMTPITEMPGVGEDYRLIFGADGEPSGVFASDGDKLFYRTLRGSGGDWTVAYDAGEAGALSRIAVSDDHARIAVVLQPGE